MTIGPCSAAPGIQTGVVQFDLAAFRAAYPQFAAVPDAAIDQNFDTAQLLLQNTCCSVVKDANKRAQFLNLLVAHLTQLLNGINGNPAGGVVGRIADAKEGTVSVSTEFATVSELAAFYAQTQFGAIFWTAVAPYRLGRYVPPAFQAAACGFDFEGAWPL